jgi:hypothetical protein
VPGAPRPGRTFLMLGEGSWEGAWGGPGSSSSSSVKPRSSPNKPAGSNAPAVGLMGAPPVKLSKSACEKEVLYVRGGSAMPLTGLK